MTDFSKLFATIRRGNLEQLTNLIESGEFNVNIANSDGFTPLVISTIYQKQDIFEKLLELGADIHHLDTKGWSLLHIAAYNQREEQFRNLVAHGIDLNIKNNQGKMAYQMANDTELDHFRQIQKELGGEINNAMDHAANFDEVSPLFGKTETETNKTETENENENEIKLPTAISSKGDKMALFVGQGTQKVGMMKDYMKIPKVEGIFNEAKEILGYDILDIIQNGPESKLNDTLISQPAIFLTSLAALLKLDNDDSSAVSEIGHTAGFSLGEYTALVFAGTIDWKDALKLIKIRAEAMQKASNMQESGMASIVGLDDSAIEKVCENSGATVANYLFPQARVLSGSKAEIQKAIEVAKSMQAKRAIELPVSGGFHSKYMQPAEGDLIAAIDDSVWSEPKCNVYSNYDAKVYLSVDNIKDNLKKHLTNSVQWESSLKDLSVGKIYELGPGMQLKSMMRSINISLWKEMVKV